MENEEPRLPAVRSIAWLDERRAAKVRRLAKSLFIFCARIERPNTLIAIGCAMPKPEATEPTEGEKREEGRGKLCQPSLARPTIR